MKAAIACSTLLVLLVTWNHAAADPIQVSNNNFGDLTAVGMNLNANLASSVNVNIANVLAAILIQLGDINPEQYPPTPEVPGWPQLGKLNSEEQKLVSMVVEKLKHH